MGDSQPTSETILGEEQQQRAEVDDLRSVIRSMLPSAAGASASRDQSTQLFSSGIASSRASLQSTVAFDLSRMVDEPPSHPVALAPDQITQVRVVLEHVHQLRQPLPFDSTVAILVVEHTLILHAPAAPAGSTVLQRPK